MSEYGYLYELVSYIFTDLIDQIAFHNNNTFDSLNKHSPKYFFLIIDNLIKIERSFIVVIAIEYIRT